MISHKGAIMNGINLLIKLFNTKHLNRKKLQEYPLTEPIISYSMKNIMEKAWVNLIFTIPFNHKFNLASNLNPNPIMTNRIG